MVRRWGGWKKKAHSPLRHCCDNDRCCQATNQGGEGGEGEGETREGDQTSIFKEVYYVRLTSMPGLSGFLSKKVMSVWG